MNDKTFSDAAALFAMTFGPLAKGEKELAEWFYVQGKLHEVQRRHDEITEEINHAK